MNKLKQKRLGDRLIQAYVKWREACLQVSDAYGSWASATGEGAAAAFTRYMAALDREERAAEVYVCVVRVTGQLISSEHDPAEPLGGPASGVGSG